MAVSTTSPQRTVRLLIQGRVQGVGYRYWTAETASALKLKGFVRNLQDGRVEVLARGEPSTIESFIELCWTGPAGAKVNHIEVSEAEPQAAAPDFSILPTL